MRKRKLEDKMSRFLGPIHHWLHSKILLQERIETSVEARLLESGIDLGSIKHWDEEYGPANPDEQLEGAIDTQNIHGWLQKRIQMAETRFAGKITELKALHGDKVVEIASSVYENYANTIAIQLNENEMWDGNLDSAHKLLHNQILEGMPCDQAGAITLNEQDMLQWKSDRCLHKAYWEQVNGDVKDHHQMRDAFNRAFFETLGNLKYGRVVESGVTYYQINR